MKNILAAILIAFTLFNCNGKVDEPKVDSTSSTILEQPTFIVDSVQVHDSVLLNKILTADYSSTVLVFPTLSNKTLLDSIYAHENFNLGSYDKKELQSVLEQKKLEYFEETKESLKDYTPDFEQSWNSNSTMKVFSNQNSILTIRYTGDGYSGGAHGYYYEQYKNFNLKTNKTYQLNDVFSTIDAKTWEPVLLKKYLRDYDEDLLFEKEIPLNSNFYFDEKSITFVYNQYEIGPYAAGVFYIKIPLAEISEYLDPQFKSEMNIK